MIIWGKEDLEVERIQAAYMRREAEVDPRLYSMFHPAHRLLRHSRERALLGLLERAGLTKLERLRILEVGCGKGEVLTELLTYGAGVRNLYGVDLLQDHLAEGKKHLPFLRTACADGRHLPFPNESFDIVLHYTMFSSILDEEVRKNVASEMLRVLRPGALLVSYDFWPDNPKNHDVRGLKLSEVKNLFPSVVYDIRRIVLAPPLARPLAQVSSLACEMLEKIPWLCTHYFVGCFPDKRDFKKAMPAMTGMADAGGKHGEIRYRPGRQSDAASLVSVHLLSFPNFFLSFLGPSFLRLLYESILRDPQGVLIVACEGDRIVGFAAGTSRQRGFYRRLLLRRKWGFVLTSLKALLRRPVIAPRLWRAVHLPRTVERASSDACLMSLAVNPEISGKGLGQTLVLAFCKELIDMSAGDVCLTTDRDGNERVNLFYQKMGFTLVRTFTTPEGRGINEYFKSLEAR